MRTYKHKNKELPSVTTILSCLGDGRDMAFPIWSTRLMKEFIFNNKISDFDSYESFLEHARWEYRRESNKALKIGGEVHGAIEFFLWTGNKRNLDSIEARNSFGAFLDWFYSQKIKVLATEQRVYGKDCAGTLDFFGKLNGKYTFLDWKTTDKMRPSYRYQIAEYRHLGRHMHRVYGIETRSDQCGVLLLPKDGSKAKFRNTTKTYRDDLRAFKSIKETFWLTHPRLRKKFNGGE